MINKHTCGGEIVLVKPQTEIGIRRRRFEKLINDRDYLLCRGCREIIKDDKLLEQFQKAITDQKLADIKKVAENNLYHFIAQMSGRK